MALSFHSRPQSGAQSGLSSMLRLASAERRSVSLRTSWWSGMSRMLRAAGSNPQARPLYAVLAGGDFASREGPR